MILMNARKEKYRMKTPYTDRDIFVEGGLVFLGIGLLWGLGIWILHRTRKGVMKGARV